MATILNKDLIRESTSLINEKNIVITLKANQSVELKLKGVRGDGLNIPILELWEYLGGDTGIKEDKDSGGMVTIKAEAPKKGDNKMISLYTLRSHNAISSLSMVDKSKFDGIISEMIKNLEL